LLWSWTSHEDEGEGLRLFDVRTGKKTTEFKPADIAGYPDLSPNGRTVAWANKANGVTLYDATTGRVTAKMQSVRALFDREPDDASLVFSDDGEYLIVTTYHHETFDLPRDPEKWHTFPVRVFRVSSGTEVSRFYANPGATTQGEKISCAACSPDNRTLAVAEAESGVIRLFEVASGEVRAELAGHRHGVHGLAFSPDGKTLASGGADNVVYLWDLTGTRASGSRQR
jgi:WD40 repeat protein